jgi:phage recombination protein Bet
MSAEQVVQVAAPQAQGQSLVARIAARFGVDSNKMLATLKATAFKSDREITNEAMMALLIVAETYHLNPFTRELFAYPDKNGGIVPVVSVDGWSRIINDSPQLDGIEFQDGPLDKNNMPEWIECIIHRKDRAHPTRVREYMVECRRDTGPWKSHPRRMLRHRSMMQCGRVAFAFSGIYDEDEAQRIVEGKAGGDAEDILPISSINKIIRSKATIEGDAIRVDVAANTPQNGNGAPPEPPKQADPAPVPDPNDNRPLFEDLAPPTDADLAQNVTEMVKRREFDNAFDLVRSIKDEAIRLRATEQIDAGLKAAQAKGKK